VDVVLVVGGEEEVEPLRRSMTLTGWSFWSRHRHTTRVLTSRGRCGAHDADTAERICYGRVRPARIHLQGKVRLP
jgi:hypothetical protein